MAGRSGLGAAGDWVKTRPLSDWFASGRTLREATDCSSRRPCRRRLFDARPPTSRERESGPRSRIAPMNAEPV